MDKGPKQNSVDIWPIPFQNDDPVNDQLENTDKILVALQAKSPLHYVVYLISEANSSTQFKLLILLK